MPLPTQLAGVPRTAADAQKYINMQISVKKFLQENILTSIPAADFVSNQLMKDTNTFFDSDANAFIFDKTTVMRYFQPDDKNAPTAEYLMVILGTKYKDDDEKGNPTIILAGVNEDKSKPGTNTFLSLNIKDPATEHPPRQTISNFPGHNIDDTPAPIEFRMI